MRSILVSIIVVTVLVGFASLTVAQEAGQVESRAHRHLMTTVEKVQSGIVWFHPTAGLEHRAVSLHKAERMGLYDPEVGDEVMLVIDENNLLIDVHKKGHRSGGHRLITGKLTYADPMWEVIEITNADGKHTLAMDESSGSKLSLLHEGKLVRAEVNEDNIVIDIYPSH